ncbi:hypothetical protein F3X72_003017 [Escherichia coli]|nr:hypothetical protein [Escherichia coli]
MKIEYTPERGRGFVRPGETGKPQNWGFSGIKKAAPKWSRLSEQITRCAVCVCDPKHKHGDDSRYQAGGQCNQSGSVRCHTCNERFSLYSLRNCSRAKAHGANLSDSCSIFLRRLFRAGDNVLVNSLSVIVLSCIAMRRNTLHHGADGDYSGSLALRRWRYSTSRFNAAVTNCPVLSPGIFTASTLFITSCGTLAATVCDFAFTAFVAMWCTPHKKQMQYAGKKISVQHLTCLTPGFKLVFNTLLAQGAETTKPGSALTLTGLLTNNVNEEPLWLP